MIYYIQLIGRGNKNSPSTERQEKDMRKDNMTNKQSDELKTLHTLNELHNLLEIIEDPVAQEVIKERIKVLNATLEKLR